MDDKKISAQDEDKVSDVVHSIRMQYNILRRYLARLSGLPVEKIPNRSDIRSTTIGGSKKTCEKGSDNYGGGMSRRRED